MKNKSSFIQNRFVRIALVTGGVLLIPLVATLLSDDFNWSRMDFVFAAVFFFIVGLSFEFIWKKFTNRKQRAVVGILAAVFFILLWAEFAVGIFTNLGS